MACVVVAAATTGAGGQARPTGMGRGRGQVRGREGNDLNTLIYFCVCN